MNLTAIKSAATAAKADSLALDFWREDVSPDDVLRLVKIAEEAQAVVFAASADNLRDLKKALKGIEP